jgi:hypothetical protein
VSVTPAPRLDGAEVGVGRKHAPGPIPGAPDERPMHA